MNYYGATIKTFKRVYHTFTPLCAESKTAEREQYIYIVEETATMLYGNAFNGRWKYSKKTGVWYNYDNYTWRVMHGDYTQVK